MDIPLSLYVHFPWCVKKCPYCDFNSHTLRTNLPEADYIDALIQDLRQQLDTLQDRRIETVFMGGGTPSLFAPTSIKRLLDALRKSGRFASDAEVTLEANPGTLDETRFEDYLYAGITRLSIGVQSFDDRLLRRIGRIHSAGQALSAIARAKQAGFERINLDLMYGLPGQSIQSSAEDIQQALAQGVSHLSVYQLTIEPNTEFAVHTPSSLPDSDQYWAMQQQAQERLHRAGFEQYEVSAYTRDSPCRHNLNYWQFGDYLAIGAGAHGKLSTFSESGELLINRYWNHRHPKDYLAAADSKQFLAQSNPVAPRERDLEYLMNALRLRSGFNLSAYSNRTQGSARTLLEKLQPFIRKHWLVYTGDSVRASETGFRFLDSILLECL